MLTLRWQATTLGQEELQMPSVQEVAKSMRTTSLEGPIRIWTHLTFKLIAFTHRVLVFRAQILVMRGTTSAQLYTGKISKCLSPFHKWLRVWQLNYLSLRIQGKIRIRIFYKVIKPTILKVVIFQASLRQPRTLLTPVSTISGMKI